MKLRISGDSVRLRVVRSELSTLQDAGVVAGRVRFPGGQSLSYSLHVNPDDRWSASFDGQAISVGMPQPEAARWFQPDQVGCRATVRLAGDDVLSVLIEKDFPCTTDRPEEENTDTFSRSSSQPSAC